MAILYMDKVIVLMSTYNGEKFIREQIESVLSQKNVEVELLVRDDGSTDQTVHILREYARKGKLVYYDGDNLQPARSFMNLVRRASEAPFYAFCDQDDYWQSDKLCVAVNALKKEEQARPLLYYGKTLLVDADRKPLPQQSRERGPFVRWEQAMICSNAAGCTMVFNAVLRDMIVRYEPTYQIMHDGWLHKVCLAISGKVIYDEVPYIEYRQHGANVVGGTTTFYKRWRNRLNRFVESSCHRSRGIAEVLNGYRYFMPKENVDLAMKIVHYKDDLCSHLKLITSVKTGDKSTDIMYWWAVLFNKF